MPQCSKIIFFLKRAQSLPYMEMGVARLGSQMISNHKNDITNEFFQSKHPTVDPHHVLALENNFFLNRSQTLPYMEMGVAR